MYLLPHAVNGFKNTIPTIAKTMHWVKLTQCIGRFRPMVSCCEFWQLLSPVDSCGLLWHTGQEIIQTNQKDKIMEDILFYNAEELPPFVNARDWLYCQDDILDDPGSLVAKCGGYLSNRKKPDTSKATSAEESALLYDAVVKHGWPGVSMSEYLWSRIARLLGLPAAPVQLTVLFPEREPFISERRLAVVVHVVQSTPAGWLWSASQSDVEERGFDWSTILKLKAFSLWTCESAAEFGEFRVSVDGHPFVIDHQDALQIGAYGDPIMRYANLDWWNQSLFPEHLRKDAELVGMAKKLNSQILGVSKSKAFKRITSFAPEVPDFGNVFEGHLNGLATASSETI